MPAADKPNLKQILRAECLPALAARAAYFSHADVRAWLRGRRLAIRPALLREYLSAAMRDGTMHDAGRGWYSRLAEPFTLDTAPVAALAAELAKAFPLVTFSCWSTEQVKGAMHHLLSKFVTFVNVEADAMESTFRDPMAERDLLIHDSLAQLFAEAHTKARRHEKEKDSQSSSTTDPLRASA